jgi:hypothetical protein
MRTTILTSVILLTLSCGQRRSNNSEFLTSDNTPIKNDLIGEWRICVTGYADMESVCNDCPTINFLSDGTATITFTNGEIKTLDWKRENEKLIIKKLPISYDELSGGEYSMEFEKKDEYTELTIIRIATSNYYVLRR